MVGTPWLSLVWFDEVFAERMVLPQDDFDDKMILLRIYLDDRRKLTKG
jgi:hypothetical protein